MFVLAGGMLLLGADKPEWQKRARQIFTNTAIGVAVILLAFVATNFLIKSIATGSVADSWNTFTCPAFLAEITAGPTIAPAITPFPSVLTPTPITLSNITAEQMRATALKNNEKYPRQNSPALKALIACIYQDPIIGALALPPPDLNGSAKQTTGVFTYDNDNEYCNYSRGQPLPGGSCGHGVGPNCHVGGRKGDQGAEALDIGARRVPVAIPGTDDGTGKPIMVQANNDVLFCQLYRLLVVEKKCSFKLLNWEVGHTHISTNTCDMDSFGVAGNNAQGQRIAVPNCSDSARLPAVSVAP
jgi:hypothetical protein